MKIFQKAIITLLAIGFIITTCSISFSAQIFKTNKKPVLVNTKPTIALLPDLTFLKKATWSKLPKEGDTIGSSAILNIFITNTGNADSKESKLKIDLSSLTGSFCPPSLSGFIDIPPLASGKSVVLAWPQMSSDKWTAGKYKFSFFIDSQNIIKEKKETNNKRGWSFNVQPKNKIILKKKPSLISKVPEKKLSMQETIKIVSLTHSPTSPKSGDHVISKLTIKSFYGLFTGIRLQCSRTIVPWSEGLETHHKYESLRIPAISTGKARTLTMEWDAIEGFTAFQCVLEKITSNNERIELYDEKRWDLPVVPDTQCGNGRKQLPDIEVDFIYHYQTKNKDDQDYTIKWKNDSPACVKTMRWKMINMEDGKELTKGSYVGGGGTHSIKGYDYREIKGQVKKSDIKKFGHVGGWWNLKAEIKVIFDYDSIIHESNEGNNSDTAVFYWHE